METTNDDLEPAVQAKQEFDINSIKKYLYKNKTLANFYCYIRGALYYTVQLEGGLYQFPIYTATPVLKDANKYLIKENAKIMVDILNLNENRTEFEKENTLEAALLIHSNKEYVSFVDAENLKYLSEDLGSTTFSAQIKASELIRWISKAIENMEFVKIG